MDESILVSYMLQSAKREVFNGKGRIFLPDFQEALPYESKPSIEEMLKSWRKVYPKIPITLATENVILIDLGESARF